MFPKVNALLEFFLKHPMRTVHLRELARQTGFSPAGALKAAKHLVEKGLLLEEKTIATTNYRVNLESPQWIPLKRVYNFHSLFRCGLVEALRKAYEEPDAIVLFGSYARGEDTDKSDVDIAVVTSLEKEFSRKSFEKSLARPINLIEVDLSKAKEEFLNALANGIVLHGYLTVR